MKKRLVALAAVVLLAGCGTPAPTTATPRVSPIVPKPAGAVDGTGSTAAPATPAPGQTCDPLASLRPGATQPTPGSMPAGSTMARIVAKGHLTVGVGQNTYLFGYRNAETGTLEGFDISILKEIAKAIFGGDDASVDNDKRIQYKVISQAQRIPAILSGDVDIVANTMTMNCARWQQVDFSTVYQNDGQRVLVLKHSGLDKGMASLGGKRVCAAKGSTSIDNIAAAPSKPLPVAVEDWTDCLVMLQQGQVDAISTDAGILAGMIAQDPNTELSGPAFTTEPYGLAISKNNADLTRFVNGVLDRKRADGTWTAIYQRWLAPLGAPLGGGPPPARYKD